MLCRCAAYDREKMQNSKITVERARGKKVATLDLKYDSLSREDQKKQKRRLQIALGVQRHLEKKRRLMSSLQAEMTRLTTLKDARREQLLEYDKLIMCEEETMTQQRKRKQDEHMNQILKQALFHQTTFFGDNEALLRPDRVVSSRTLEFHDWMHSYMVLMSRDTLVRRKVYVAHFPQSKMDLAKKLVLRNTEAETQKLLATDQAYCRNVKILHDGIRDTQELDGRHTDVGRPNTKINHCDTIHNDAGDGRVTKEFASVFLFQETAHCTIGTLMDMLFASMKSIGVYYPGSAYQSHLVDEVYQDNEVTISRVYYSDLRATMQPFFEVVDDLHNTQDIKVEARVLSRELRGRD